MFQPGSRGLHSMPDVFLSYKREDEHAARLLVQALERRGFSVWWDREIVPSQNWHRQIEEAVRQARCVIVVWSRHSVESDWVREEASFEREQGKFLPVLLEDADIPLPFRLIQAADLRDWDGREDHPALGEIEAGVRACLDKSTAPGPARGAPASRDRLNRARLISLAWILLPSAVVVLLLLGLMRWRVPTAVDIDVSVRRTELRTHGSDPQVLLESTEARSMALRGFDELRLSPAALWIADPARYDLKRDTYPEDAWTVLSAGQSLILRPADRTAATVTIRPPARSGGSLVLDRVFAGPADVLLESPEPGSLAVKLLGQRQTRAFSLPEEFWLVADYCARDGAAWPQQGQSVTLRARTRQDHRLLEFSSSESGVSLAVEYLPGRKEPILARDFAVSQAQLLDQGPTGQPESTLTGPGAIRYADYPGIEPVQLNANDFLVLGDLRHFLLRRIELLEHERGLRLRFHGLAGRVSSGPKGSTRDHRLTQFDILWRNRGLVTLFTVLVWLLPTLVAVRRFFRESHR